MNDYLCLGNRHYFDRDCDYFAQNRSRYLKDTGTFWDELYPLFISMLIDKELEPIDDNALRFGTIQVQPHLNVTRNGNGFFISGPHFSVLAVVARYFNFTLQGTHIFDEDIVDATLKDRLEFAVSDISPVFRITLDIFDGTLVNKYFFGGLSMSSFNLTSIGSITQTLGVQEMDAIIQVFYFPFQINRHKIIRIKDKMQY